MTFSHKILFFANSFSIGLIAPVLSLIFLTHGAAIETLSLYIGIYAVTVVLLEVPSGMIADSIGRKKVFLISHCLLLCNYLLILFSNTPFLLACACILMGMGRAFGSGSMEALEIELCIKKNGTESVPKINSILAAIDSIGSASGALCGGFLGYMDSGYSFLLLILLLLEIFLIVFSACIVTEKTKAPTVRDHTKNIRFQIYALFHTIKESKTILTILVMSVVLGISLSAIETYWQPALLRYLPANLSWILGVISCFGYFGVSIGNKCGEWFLDFSPTLQLSLSSKPIWALRLLLPVIIMSFGLCDKWYIFIFLYTLVYVILGAGNLLENTVFHLAVDNANRATMISVSSLFLRGGGVLSSILGSLFLLRADLADIWFFLPGCALLATICIMYLWSKYNG